MKKGLPLPMNTTFTKAAKKGERVITVKHAAQYHPNVEILIGADNVKGQRNRAGPSPSRAMKSRSTGRSRMITP